MKGTTVCATRLARPRGSPDRRGPLLLPARRQRPLQPLQHQRLIRPPREDRLHDVGRQQRQPQDPASVIGPRVSIPHRLRRVAELVLLSVVDAKPPHDAVRWSGRANLTCVVQLRGRPPPDPRLHPIHASPRRDLVAGSRSHPCQVRRQPRAPLGCPSEIACHQATCGAAPRRACGRAPPWLSSCPGEWRRAWPRP